MEVVLGVDVGTTAIKAVATGLDGAIMSTASRPTPWRHDGPHFDIDPTLLADTVIAVLVEAARTAQGTVVGIGVTGIAETGILLDRHGHPCAPALAWFDPRGDAAPVRAVVSDREFRCATGMRLNSKPSLAKILWLRAHVPTAHDAVVHLGVGDWIVHALGGRQSAEVSVASRSALMDVTTSQAWAPAIDLVGDLLPGERVWAGDALGTVGPDGPLELRGAVLTNAGHDHQTACLLAGAAHPGVLFDSIGTAEALIRIVPGALSVDQVDAMTDADINVGQTVVRDHQVLLAGRLTGLSLERISSLLGATTREQRTALGARAVDVVRDDSFPRLVDVGNDHLTITDVTDGITPEVMWRAAVEDLVELAARPLEVMAQVAGPHDSSVLVGGWIRNPMLAQAKERNLGAYRVLDVAEPGAVGAAFLGAVAAGRAPLPKAGEVPHWAS